jgi:DNA-binding response OmpR family regulator
LTRAGFVVDLAESAEEGGELLKGFVYELIILDWTLPGAQGIDFLRSLRAGGKPIKVLMLTGNNTIDHKAAGLDSGADDYLTKPFDLRELAARVRALLRRPQVLESTELAAANVVLDTRSQRVLWHGVELKVTNQEYQLLELLMRNKNEVFSHDALVERAWSSFSESSAETVRVHMSRLRKKFEGGATPCPVKTVHGKGYIFEDR